MDRSDRRFALQGRCAVRWSAFATCVLFGWVSVANAAGPATRPTGPFLPFGTEPFAIPPATQRVNVTSSQLERFRAAIANADGPERVEYIHELARCGPAALPIVLSSIRDPDAAVRAEVARAAKTIGDVTAAEMIAGLCVDADATVRREAVLTSAAFGNLGVITKLLDDESDSVCRAALHSASTPQQADRIASLLTHLRPPLVTDALDALGRIGAKAHQKVIVPFLVDRRVAVRVAAIRAIGRSGDPTLQDHVTGRLNDAHPSARREAMLAIGLMVAPDVKQRIALSVLNDPDPTVREAAATVLQACPTENAIDSLLKQLDDPYVPLHNAARESLARIGRPVANAAAAMLLDRSAERRIDGSYLLGALSSAAALPEHIALLDDPDYAVSAQAAKSLYTIAPPAEQVGPRVSALVARVTADLDPPAVQKQAAAAAIRLAGRVGYRAIIPTLVGFVPETPGAPSAPEAIRRSAIWALGVLATPDSPAGNAIRDVAQSRSQTFESVFESYKARINMNDPTAAELFSHWQTAPELNVSDACRWIAHLGNDHFAETHTPFTPATIDGSPDLSISSLP